MGNPTDVTDNIDTTGFATGPTATVAGISPLFDDLEASRERRKPKTSKDEGRITPGGKGTPDVPDTSGTTEPVAGFGDDTSGYDLTGQYDTSAGLAPGHIDTSTPGEVASIPQVDLGDSLDSDGQPIEGDDPDNGEGGIESQSEGEGQKATIEGDDPASAYNSMTIPEILAHADSEGHEFPEEASRKADYIDSLIAAGVAPPK